jgi:hypothetical protein
VADSPAPRDGGRLSASPADGCGCQYDAAGRLFRTRCICPPEMTPEQTLRAVAGLGGAIGDAVAGVLAELDEARRRLRELETRVPSGFLGALDAVEQSEPLAEWTCPGCGATTRARMADRAPRVWLEGDEVPAETWFLTDEGSVEQDCTARTVDPDWSGPLVEVFVPDEAAYDAAVAAERERRALRAAVPPSEAGTSTATNPGCEGARDGSQPDCGASGDESSGSDRGAGRSAVQGGPGGVGAPVVMPDEGPDGSEAHSGVQPAYVDLDARYATGTAASDRLVAESRRIMSRPLGPDEDDVAVWIPPDTVCLDFGSDPCPHCLTCGGIHRRTGRCGSCGRRRDPAAPPEGPAARLRSAADLIERTASTARAYVVDPWAGHIRDTLVPWVALMSPDLAAPLAAWLRERADYADAVGFCNDREALALADVIHRELLDGRTYG